MGTASTSGTGLHGHEGKRNYRCWKTVLQKTIYPIILNTTVSQARLCWNEERGIHLINYEEQPDSMCSFFIVLGSATACDDTLNAFATE